MNAGHTARTERAPSATSPLDGTIIDRIDRLRAVVFDFDGVFTDNTVLVSEDGTESVRCWRGDGLGLRKLEQLGLDLSILSTETNPVVAARARKLKLACVHGCDDKLTELRRATGESGVPLDQVCFVGNDINDLTCLSAVGLAVVVADAHPDVVQAAHLRTTAPGGRGAVRELCDLIAAVRTRTRS